MASRVSSTVLVLTSFLVAFFASQPPPAAEAYPMSPIPCITYQCKLISAFVSWFGGGPAPNQVQAFFEVDGNGDFVRAYNASGTRCNRIGQPLDPGWTLFTIHCPSSTADKCVNQDGPMIYKLQLTGSVICGGVTPGDEETILLEGTEPDVPARPDSPANHQKARCDNVPPPKK